MVAVKHAEQECRNHAVEVILAEIRRAHVHLEERHLAAHLGAAPFGAAQHRWTEVDARDLAARRIEGNIAPGADPGVEDAAAQSCEHFGAHGLVAAILEGRIEKVVKPGDSLICALFAHRPHYMAPRLPRYER